MQRYDLCQNSATLTREQKSYVNDKIWPRLEEIQHLYQLHGARGNLYLGGSLGLLQPAVLVENGHPVAVKSDLDLFYLVEVLPPSQADQRFLQSVAALPDDLDISVHVMPAVDIDASPLTPAYDDLLSSLERPVCRGFDFPPPLKAKTFEEKTVASLAIGWLAACVMPYYVSTHQYANLEADRVSSDAGTPFKAGDIFLRVPCYSELRGDYSRRRVLELARNGYFEGICEPDTVLEILTRREQVDLTAAPATWSVEGLWSRVSAKQLGLELSSDPETVARTVIRRHLCEPTAFDRLHSLELALALWRHQPSPGRAELVREQAEDATAYLDEDTAESLKGWLAHPEVALASQLLSAIKSRALQAVTDRLTTLVLQAYQKNREEESPVA